MTDPQEFITLAGKLVAQGKAGARAAISRAYYGALHLALGVLERLAAERPGGGKAHNLVPQYLRCADLEDGAKAADYLADLHSDRIRADDRLNDPKVESQRAAMDCVELAAAIALHLATMETACQNDAGLRSKLKAGIDRVKAIHRV